LSVALHISPMVIHAVVKRSSSQITKSLNWIYGYKSVFFYIFIYAFSQQKS
jgi:hypothetical protein